ncbi:Protein of unknown function [Micromonospora phaseoli]|uniref:DUF4229 domain-containing protein n=1 Tax=Micromonospora phaseoli TaxID=1144548 RepID=A0A1H7ARR9_9ACTN|nr:DUF4229 domain-containing protein [Micromonospora phaseoli]PZV96234.1 uncharacterized protein DUF4229 [Micromonospora phaseoli]SEJ67636.1 Protein of unknown function [Micromonospora phaseoli]
MSAAVKYTLGRIGLFVVVVAALWPVDLDIFLKLILALLFSAAVSFFLLKGWRDEMAEEMAAAAERRRTEKERLRAALAGDDQTEGDAPAGGQVDSAADQPGDTPGPGRGPSA